MALPQRHHQFQQQQPKALSISGSRDLYNVDGQISAPVNYAGGPNLPDHSQHPPYIPPFHVAGFAPGPVKAADVSDGGGELQWNYSLEPNKKRPKEQDFLENNSQLSSVDFLQARSVSTGLGLSLDNGRLGSVDSPFLGLIGDDVELELQRQNAEFDRFLNAQGDRLRLEILEKVQAKQLQTISYVEEKVLEKLHKKEAKVENINKKNVELELRMQQMALEVGAWQQRVKCNQDIINTLKYNLQQVYAQSRDSKEGCGDSEVDDTASCQNGCAIDLHAFCKENSDRKGFMTCKACQVNQVCMLLLPCKHLCLCKECEIELNFCPLCKSSKLMSLEIYM